MCIYSISGLLTLSLSVTITYESNTVAIVIHISYNMGTCGLPDIPGLIFRLAHTYVVTQ